jgi:dephospho-CoA kinase
VAAEGHATTGDYADAKEPWFVDAYRRAWAWADETGWRP